MMGQTGVTTHYSVSAVANNGFPYWSHLPHDYLLEAFPTLAVDIDEGSLIKVLIASFCSSLMMISLCFQPFFKEDRTSLKASPNLMELLEHCVLYPF